jgi:hypothetical protein
MKTYVSAFEIGERTYHNNGNGYFYLITEGKKTRIKRTEFEEAYNEFLEMNLSEAKEATEKSVENEAVLEAAENAQGQGKAKRTYKKRTPKDVDYRKTFNDTEITLTRKQVDFLYHISDTCYWEQGLDSAIWIDCLCDEIGGEFAGKPMTVGAMVSTLCEKGVCERWKEKVNGKKCTALALTELGKLVAKDLGL